MSADKDKRTEKSKEAVSEAAAVKAIDAVQGAYVSAIRNGLLVQTSKTDTSKEVGECETALESGNKALEDGKYAEVLDHVRKADASLSTAIEKRGKLWRFWNQLAIPWIVWLALWGVLVAYVSYQFYIAQTVGSSGAIPVDFIAFRLSITASKSLILLILTALSGSLGAVLRGLYYLTQQVSQRQFKRNWSSGFLATPLIGFLFGVVVFLTIGAGLLLSTRTIEPTTRIFHFLASFLLGFNWKLAHSFIDRVGNAVLGTTPPAQQ